MNIKKLFVSIITALLLIPTLTNAEDIEGSYSGEYTLDYLLRNYNVVTFGQNNNVHVDYIKEILTFQKGNANLAIEGSISSYFSP